MQEGLSKFVETVVPSKAPQAGEIFAACNAITGSDECDTARNIGFCLKEQGDKLGVPFAPGSA